MHSLEEDEKNLTEIVAISEKKPFRIPKYQRGYRWQSINVTDLLNDLKEFLDSTRKTYSMQPLVVKDAGDYWNVVDGQQRLTTFAILMQYLGLKHCGIEFETESRKDLKLTLTESQSNIDQYHVNQAYTVIHKWFENNDEEKLRFAGLLSDCLENKHVKFIWFNTPDDELRTFIRLNKDKIALTNAELIKAMLLKQGNFVSYSNDTALQQKTIAVEWNSIENTLQDDAFWCFIRPKDNNPTRIDYIFQIIKDKNYLEFNVDEHLIGTDKYSTFRYFHEFSKECGRTGKDAFKLIWDQVSKIYDTLCHWFNDIDLFHYIGFLVIRNGGVLWELLDIWNSPGCTLSSFKNKIRDKIRMDLHGTVDLDKVYKSKRSCIGVLLLFNIESIVVLNRNMKTVSETNVIHKFPFHLYKEEKWDVEHIASSTDNDFSDENSKKEWLLTFLLDNQITEELRKEIKSVIRDFDEGAYEDLRARLIKIQTDSVSLKDRLSTFEDKNQIWNFCLLDESTNRSYGNAIFPVKRRVIMGKEMGLSFGFDDELNVVETVADVAYVPSCTVKDFLKAYTFKSTSPREWTKEDAKGYKKAIFDCLKAFGVTYKGE